MIRKLKINNFQSHKNTEIIFDKGVNVIIGSSDSGKSAILRALRLLLWNKPRGDGYRSHWGGDTSVTLEDSEGNIIIRKKSNSENSYQVNDTLLKAFGNDPPVEVVEVLNVDELNFQSQSDLYYLINKTPGEVASHFNRMAQLEKIDSSRKYIETEIRQTEQDIKSKTTRQKELKDDLREYTWLKEAEQLAIEWEEVKTEKKDKEKQVHSLSVMMDALSELQEHISTKEKIIKAADLLSEIEINNKEKITAIENSKKLKILISRINGFKVVLKEKKYIVTSNTIIQDIIAKSQEKQRKTEDAKRLSNLLEENKQILKKITKYEAIIPAEELIKNLQQNKTVLNQLVKKAGSLSHVLKTIEKKTIELEREQKEVLVLEKQMPETCPICQTKIRK